MFSKQNRLSCVYAIAIIGILSAHAMALDDTLTRSNHGMSLSVFDPAVDTKGHITMDGSPVLPHLAFSVGLMLDFGFNGWPAVEQSNTQPTDDFDPYNNINLDKMITARFIGNFGLWDRIAIGMGIPIVVPSGQFYELDIEDQQQQSHWSTDGSFGDITLHIKASLLRSDWHPVGLAFIAQYLIPTGKSEVLSGEPGAGAVVLKTVFDAEPGLRYRVGLNAGIRLPLGAETDNLLAWNVNDTLLFKYGPTLYFGVGQSLNLWPGIMDLVLEFYGNSLIPEMADTRYLSLEAGGGFKIYIEENSYLMAGYSHGIPIADTGSGYGFQNVEHRMFLGFSYEPSMDLRLRQQNLDRDGDGIPDHLDKCPDEPGPAHNDGCPDNDMDKDGIPDHLDRCPLEPGLPENDGCPEESKEYVGDATATGTVPEEPEPSDVVITNSSLMIMKKVYFEYNSDKIKSVSFKILDEVARTLINNPQITKMEIQGHADERGNARYNLKLTQRRAAAVERYLIDKDVPRDILQHKGYGDYCPVNPESNEAAWEENRRVEFKIVEINNEPTGVELSCPKAKARGIR